MKCHGKKMNCLVTRTVPPLVTLVESYSSSGVVWSDSRKVREGGSNTADTVHFDKVRREDNYTANTCSAKPSRRSNGTIDTYRKGVARLARASRRS